jgi:hypothetical protein
MKTVRPILTDTFRLKVVMIVEKGARDARGRFIKAGVRLKSVRKGDPDYDKAGWTMAHVMMGARFKVKRPPLSVQIKKMWAAVKEAPFSVAELKKASKPWLSNLNPYGLPDPAAAASASPRRVANRVARRSRTARSSHGPVASQSV